MPSAVDYSLYLVTDPVLCRAAGLIETVTAAVAGGATIVQLRDPDADTRALMEQARALLGVLRPRGIPLIINDRADVCVAAGADGVHLGQDDMAALDARRILGPNALIGLSVGSETEFAASRADLDAVDYVGIGPVASTRTKNDAGSAIGVEGFAAVRRMIAKPAVAIGGVGAAHIAGLAAAGADGIAVVSAICGRGAPGAEAAALAAAWRAARA
jgi:thiamine-phosphate pyrophosphorylase